MAITNLGYCNTKAFPEAEDEENVDEIDTGGEPLREHDCQPTHIDKTSKFHMHEPLTASASEPFTYVEAKESPQRNHWKWAMEEESTSILLNNTFTALNSGEAWQLQVRPIWSNWVYKTKHNPDGYIWYKARLVIKGYEQTDFGETHAPVGKLTMFWYLISLSWR